MPNFAALCTKNSHFLTKMTLFFSSVPGNSKYLFYTFLIDSSFTLKKTILKGFETLVARADFVFAI
jgi:hypothetical protein